MNQFTSIAKSINKSCLCKTLDRSVLTKNLEDQTEIRDLLQERPGLFSETALFISQDELEKMKKVIESIEILIQGSQFKAEVLKAPLHNQELKGVFMGYDFHLTEEGPKLIEINTNAGGAYLNFLLAKAQVACCKDSLTAVDLEKVEDKFFDIFCREWKLVNKNLELKTIVIMDEQPAKQYLYPEFKLFRDLFIAKGIDAYIADPSELDYRDNALWIDNKKVDLIYNRTTDFYFVSDVYSGIRTAYSKNEVIITPNPYHHAVYANKENLEVLTDRNKLMALGSSESMLNSIIDGIPRTIKVTDANRNELWEKRRKFFFKPVAGYGSKATYRGDKITLKVWNEISKADYVAQELSPPGIRMIEKDGEQFELKNDVRVYTYNGEILLLASRLYSGQTTNFRTAGGGFAAVFII